MRRILVVDDEPFVCDAVRMMLTSDGHIVETANSGQEALSLLDNHEFDVIVADYVMPGMRGDQLAAAVKARAPNLPVIIITAYAETLESSNNPQLGADCILSKPFCLQDMREAITRVLLEKKPTRNDS